MLYCIEYLPYNKRRRKVAAELKTLAIYWITRYLSVFLRVLEKRRALLLLSFLARGTLYFRFLRNLTLLPSLYRNLSGITAALADSVNERARSERVSIILRVRAQTVEGTRSRVCRSWGDNDGDVTLFRPENYLRRGDVLGMETSLSADLKSRSLVSVGKKQRDEKRKSVSWLFLRGSFLYLCYQRLIYVT